MVLSSGNSDTRHRCENSILFDGLADTTLELVKVHAPRLLHDFCDA